MTPPSRLLVASLAVLVVGCGARSRPAVSPAPPAALPVTLLSTTGGSEITLLPDRLAPIIARVAAAFAEGERELAAGRLVAARERFDEAVDAMLALPDGARSNPRLTAQFEQLLDRISALDVQALRDGDGFTETSSEPAAIDELLNNAMFEPPKPATTTRETVLMDLERTSFDLDIPANEKVLSYVELFQGRLREFMAEGLGRSQRYLPMIREAFEAEGVPGDLAYVPLIESAFKPTALSRARARGMWQFMPTTGHEYGLKQTWFVDERADPEKATVAAARYLKALHSFFDGDWNLALAAYNAGPGRVQTAIRRARTSDFWKLTAGTRYLPRETRQYVPMIMAATLIAKNPALYGFDEVGATNALAYERVTVPNALDLKIIAEWINVSVDELRDLNPELRRTTTPMGDHDLKVPLGTGPTLRARLATVDSSLFVQFEFHTVKRGETISSIARRYHITQADLRLANELGTRSRIRVNQSLLIPQRAANALPSASPARGVAAAPSAAAGPLTYRVRRGDTLFRIARQFDTTVAVLKQLNRLRSDTINVGDRLTVRQ
jgi:membrane-bound lytic murein transglycosylase D